MIEFGCEFYDQNGDRVPAFERLQFSPTWYSAAAVGGYDTAEVQVDGPQDAMPTALRLIGYTIYIRNQNGTLVWAGVVDEATVTYGATQVGLSIRDIVNRVKVTYTTADADGTLQRVTTDWAEDAESIARYGYSERVYTKSDVSAAQAEAYRDTMLAKYKHPTPIIRSLRGATAASASLACKGQWALLDRQLYANTAGLVEYNTSGGADQLLGVGVTSTQIGFAGTKILDFGNRLDALPTDASIVISGSADNDGTVTTIRAGSDGETYTATTISFDPSDDILDSASGLGFINDYDIIDVSGSTAQDGVRVVSDAINAEHITVSGTAITTEAAGPSITIVQAGYVETDTTFTGAHKVVDSDSTPGNDPANEVYAELPGETVTLTVVGVKVAQKFTLSADVDWTVNDIAIRAKKVGSPADNLVCGLYTNSSGSPGTLIESATIAGSEIGTGMTWRRFTFGNTNTIEYGTDYWIVMSRSGSNSMTDYYIVDVAEDLGYAGGNLKLWTGSAWVARDPDADMPFIVRGAEETTLQAQNILTNAAQFIAGVDIADASNVESNQYREGEGTALYELEQLLESGTDTGARLLARVTPNRFVSIYEQPASDIMADLIMLSDGTITQPSGRPIEPGMLPTAQWVRVQGLQRGVDHLAPLVQFFIERAEYHVENGEWSLEPPTADSVWDTGLLIR